MRVALAALVLAGCGSSLPSAQETGDCASCHPQQAQELAASRHSSASTSPAFTALRAQAGSNATFCVTCHQPDGASAGLTCLTCHTAIGNQADQNGQLLWNASGPVEVGDATGLNAPHAVQATGFLTSSDLCATCHDVNGPGAFHERPFESWQQSPAAKVGQQCQACHLSPNPGLPTARPLIPVALGATQPRPHASHSFVGMGADPASAAALLSAGLSLQLAASDGGYELQVTNVGQGHHALAGAGFIRELVAVVESLDADGGATSLASLPLDVTLTRDGAPEPNPLLSDASDDEGLDPGAMKSVEVAAPTGAVQLRACLTFADVRPELSSALGIVASPEQQAGCVEVSPPPTK